jgi:hypothetical protein
MAMLEGQAWKTLRKSSAFACHEYILCQQDCPVSTGGHLLNASQWNSSQIGPLGVYRG